MTDAPKAKPAGPFSAWEFGLAWRYLQPRRKEFAVSVIALISFLGIGAAVFLLITTMSIMAGFRHELLDRMLSFNGHMFVQGYVLQADDRDQALQRIAAVPGVKSVAPLINSQSLVQARGQTTGAIVRGIRPQDLHSVSFVYESLTADARRSFGQGAYGGDGILIGKSLAQSLGLGVGDPITLFSPTGADSALGNLGGLEKTYRVGGVFSSGTAEFDRAFIFMPLEQAQLFFGKEGVWDVVELKVDNPDQVEHMLGPVRRAAGNTAMVSDWRDGMAAFWGALKVERVAMSLILGVQVGVATLLIIAGIVMLVKNKTRDIAILRTVGASQASMLRIFFIAGASIGIAGMLFGLILGLVVCLNIGAIQHFIEGLLNVKLFDAEVYQLDSIPALVDPVDVLWVVVWSLFMSCVASLLPSWRAAKMDPVEALRYE